ncbi:unnamed protein product [Dracunculus medinensis]|uniref:Uncharacterized protein n=1 Tax=Dracunculus medinensis TaxID=318479 RepID=A0A0N4UPT5_DRAME|nr:unnamed protein product [Dracunculus medinensis]
MNPESSGIGLQRNGNSPDNKHSLKRTKSFSFKAVKEKFFFKKRLSMLEISSTSLNQNIVNGNDDGKLRLIYVTSRSSMPVESNLLVNEDDLIKRRSQSFSIKDIRRKLIVFQKSNEQEIQQKSRERRSLPPQMQARNPSNIGKSRARNDVGGINFPEASVASTGFRERSQTWSCSTESKVTTYQLQRLNDLDALKAPSKFNSTKIFFHSLFSAKSTSFNNQLGPLSKVERNSGHNHQSSSIKMDDTLESSNGLNNLCCFTSKSPSGWLSFLNLLIKVPANVKEIFQYYHLRFL